MNRRIFGVDFSGAARAGDLIWLSEVETGRAAHGLRLLTCRPARELPGGGRDRAAALAALASFIAATPEAAFGCDFPFSLPLAHGGGRDWASYVADFPRRFADADGFRASCMAESGGRELKRPTDREARVPFGAYNIRLYRQTYQGIGGLLSGLVAAGGVTAPPMQPAVAGRACLLEICPASTLRRLGLHGRPYKGRTIGHREARRHILEGLVSTGLLARPRTIMAGRVVDDPGGDALDSVVAALACARALAEPGFDRPRTPEEAFEGRVYY